MKIAYRYQLSDHTKTFYKGEEEEYKTFVRELNRPFQVIEYGYNERPKNGGRGFGKPLTKEQEELIGKIEL